MSGMMSYVGTSSGTTVGHQNISGGSTQWIEQQPAPTLPPTPTVTPVTPSFDPKIDANALYGKHMAMCVLGYAKIGASPAPLVGPYIVDGKSSFIVSFGVPANPIGTRKIYAIYFDNELAWSSTSGGTVPADGTFEAAYVADPFDFTFKQGTLTQTVCSLETLKFPGDENAYRPQMVLELLGVPIARPMVVTGKPVPYVACLIGDTTDGADPFDGLNLGDALERVAHSPWVGYDTSTFEAVNITDVIPAILIKDNLNIDQLCQVEARIYRNLDYVISDKRYVKDHGADLAADILFGLDTIVGGRDAVQISRSSPSSLPREFELWKIDPDQDYTIVPSISKRPRDPIVVSASAGKETITLPNVMDAETGQAMITFAQYYEENARERVTFSAMAYGLQIEPGDLFALVDIADGIDNKVWKCTSTLAGANYVTQIEGEATLRCFLYGDEDNDPFLSNVVLLLGFEGSDGSTSISDESPQASFHPTGTVIGNAQIDTAQFKFGVSSLLSDGTGDGVSFVDTNDWDLSDANSDQFTIELWARTTSATPTDRAFVWQGGVVGSCCFAFRTNTSGNGEIEFLGATGGTFNWSVATSGINWATGTWYHIAVDKDFNGKVRLYRDGVMVASDTPASSVLFNSSQTLRVACDGSGGRSWPGWIDEVRITKGMARYASDAGFDVPTAAFPRV